MQQPKIEVRARDERRRDEACAKWSTVERERGMRETGREGMKYFEKKKKKESQMGSRTKGRHKKNEEGRKMRGEERGN